MTLEDLNKTASPAEPEIPENVEGAFALQGQDSVANDPQAEGESAFKDAESSPSRGRHAKHVEEEPEYVAHSRKMRKILIIVAIILAVLIVVGGILIFMLVDTAKNAATQQTQVNVQQAASIDEGEEKDNSSTTAKTTTVPDLVQLLGCTTEEVISRLQHGAQTTSITQVNEEGNPVKYQVKIALTSEPSDTKSGTPTVYLNCNEVGRAIQAGYSASTSSLGYGSISFADAVANEHIIESTLEEAGLTVSEGSVTLPSDKTKYSTYASDGKTLTKETYTFTGEGTANGAAHKWRAVLSYDYSLANATGNLADTVRTIYVYIDA